MIYTDCFDVLSYTGSIQREYPFDDNTRLYIPDFPRSGIFFIFLRHYFD